MKSNMAATLWPPIYYYLETIGLALTSEPDEIEMQTWSLIHGF